MKLTSLFQKLALALLAATVLAALPAAAQTGSYHLNGPYGLALDSAGNLYVANQNANQILIYGTNYKQETAKTITQSVSFPSGVAVDLWGDIFVANYGGSYVSVYYPDGTQDGSQTITNGILGPNAIAADGFGNVWVNNSGLNVTVYGSINDGYPRPLIYTLTEGYPMYGLAVGGTTWYGRLPVAAWAVGSTGAALIGWEQTYLEQGGMSYNVFSQFGTAILVAFETIGNGIFVATPDGTVESPGASFNVKMAHPPAGMVVDSARHRIYLSDNAANRVYAYDSWTGTLLHTFK